MCGRDKKGTKIFWFENLKGKKRPLGRPRHRWEDNCRMVLRERCGLDASGLGLGPVAGYCEHSNEPSGSKKGREFLD